MNEHEPNRWKGFVLGVLGGVAGTVAMGYYWKAATALAGKDPRMETTDAGPDALESIALIGKHHQDDESSTAAIGRIGYRSLAGAEPGQETKATLSNVVHFGYGPMVGGVYGALRATAPAPDFRGGLLYGTALWLLGDELGVSLLGLAEGPARYPLAQHLHRLGAHLTYGVAMAATTRVLDRLT